MLSLTPAWPLGASSTTDPSADPSSPELFTHSPVADLELDQPNTWWEWFVGVPLQILLIVVIGLTFLFLLRRLIHKITDHIAEGTPLLERRGWKGIGESQVGSALLRANPLATARRSQRARTVGSVLRSAANIIIGLTLVLMVLGQLGVNLAPFLASAGIAGVALGFGAQSLVKDFLSGTFMLLEDQYGVGDVVDFGDITGVVEEVALRVTKVRDSSGTLWFVRNGEILRTGNKTQEWGRAVVELRVIYDVDEDTVRAVLLAAGQAIKADPVLSEYCLEDPEVLGTGVLTAEAIELKVQIKTTAGMQWDVARSLRVQVRAHLAAAKIPLAGAQQVILYDHTTPPRSGEPARVGAASGTGSTGAGPSTPRAGATAPTPEVRGAPTADGSPESEGTEPGPSGTR